jgi:anti-sigma B factor antagonist
MKRHRMAPTQENVGTRSGEGAAPRIPTQRRAFFVESTHARDVASEISFVPSRTRAHTLILTGELDGGSAPTLEAEIERLCDEGVTALTLDLSELERIDSVGATVVAFRSKLCRRRGCDLAVIPGAGVIRRALEQAGIKSSTLRNTA